MCADGMSRDVLNREESGLANKTYRDPAFSLPATFLSGQMQRRPLGITKIVSMPNLMPPAVGNGTIATLWPEDRTASHCTLTCYLHCERAR